jgi:hypothetical protein
VIAVPDMPRRYVPTLFALQMPEVFLILTVAGTLLAVRQAVRHDVAVRLRAALVLLAVAAVLPICITVVTRPAMYNGIRHFVFVTPPLAALGGYAAACLLARLARHSRAAVVAGAAILAIGFSLPIVEFVRLHPYQYTHFNHLAGGVAGADGRYMRDYWGLSFRQAAVALKAKLAADGLTKPPDRPWKIAVCGPHPPARVALGPDFEPTWDPKDADLALMLGEYYCARPAAPLLAEVRRAGVIYARAYDLRGRTLENLFTLPPVQ